MDFNETEQKMLTLVFDDMKELKSKELKLMELICHFVERWENGEETGFQETSEQGERLEEMLLLLQEQKGVLLYCKEKGFISNALYSQSTEKINRNAEELRSTLQSIHTYLKKFR